MNCRSHSILLIGKSVGKNIPVCTIYVTEMNVEDFLVLFVLSNQEKN